MHPHTPGPWYVKNGDEIHAGHGLRSVRLARAYKQGGNDPSAEDFANAALMARAPELAREARALRSALAAQLCSCGQSVADGHAEDCEAGIVCDGTSELDCDHCGGTAITSYTGLFSDGDGGQCEDCGFPGWVTVDDRTAWWNGSDSVDARCMDHECPDCPTSPTTAATPQES